MDSYIDDSKLPTLFLALPFPWNKKQTNLLTVNFCQSLLARNYSSISRLPGWPHTWFKAAHTSLLLPFFYNKNQANPLTLIFARVCLWKIICPYPQNFSFPHWFLPESTNSAGMTRFQLESSRNLCTGCKIQYINKIIVRLL